MGWDSDVMAGSVVGEDYGHNQQMLFVACVWDGHFSAKTCMPKLASFPGLPLQTKTGKPAWERGYRSNHHCGFISTYGSFNGSCVAYIWQSFDAYTKRMYGNTSYCLSLVPRPLHGRRVVWSRTYTVVVAAAKILQSNQIAYRHKCYQSLRNVSTHVP